MALFLFTGEETFLINEQVKAWKQAFLEKHGDLNLLHLDGSRIEVNELMSQVEALPFLGDKRLIFVDHIPPKAKPAGKKATKADEKQAEQSEKLMGALERVPESSVVVFVQSKPDKRKKLYKKMVQVATIKSFDRLEGAALHSWISQQFKMRESSADYAVIQHLVSLVGQDLWRLSQEVEKLALYAEEGVVTAAMIDDLVVPSIEANIFHFTDALSARLPKKAMSHLHRSMAAGESLHQVFYMIIRQFRLFLQTQGYLVQFPRANSSGVASALKIHPFVAKNVTRQVKFFNISELKEAYQALLKIDHQLKTSGIKVTAEDQSQLALAIEKFILKFCSQT